MLWQTNTHSLVHRSRPAEPQGKWEQRSTQAHSATAALICPPLSQTRTLSLTDPDTCSTLTSTHTPAQGHTSPPYSRILITSFTDGNSALQINLKPSWLHMQICKNNNTYTQSKTIFTQNSPLKWNYKLLFWKWSTWRKSCFNKDLQIQDNVTIGIWCYRYRYRLCIVRIYKNCRVTLTHVLTNADFHSLVFHIFLQSSASAPLILSSPCNHSLQINN